VADALAAFGRSAREAIETAAQAKDQEDTSDIFNRDLARNGQVALDGRGARADR
jgi:hypothetical protein